MSKFRQSLVLAVVVGAQSFVFSNVAFGNSPEQQKAPNAASAATAPASTEAAAAQPAQPAAPQTSAEPMVLKSKGEMKEFVSDGRPLFFEDLGLNLVPVNGWDVTTGGVVTAIMQEPEVKVEPSKIDYSQPKFRRNITVATIHKALPLDEQRAQEIIEQLNGRYGKDPFVKNFQIVEHKFVDHRAKNDALLIYSSMTLDKYDMMQLHVVLAGSEKQFLLTYTDFAKDFKEQNAVYASAWTSMLSSSPTGEAPVRYADLMIYGPIAAGLILLMLIGLIMRKVSNARYLRNIADQINSDSFEAEGAELTTATSAVWNLSSKHASRLSEDGDEEGEAKLEAANSSFSNF